MKNVFAFVVFSAFLVLFTLPVSAGNVTVTDDFEDVTPPSPMIHWNPDPAWQAWTVLGGIGDGGTQGARSSGASWHRSYTQNGVPAPINVGDVVTVEMRFQITVGSGPVNPIVNGYAWSFGLCSANDGTGAGPEMIFVRKTPDYIGLAGVGSPWWPFAPNLVPNSEIGLGSPVFATSDWFSLKMTVTKTATGYNVLGELLRPDGTMACSSSNYDQTLPTMAAASTWYAKIGLQNPLNDCDITEIMIDNLHLESTWADCDPAVDAGYTLAGDLSGRVGIPDCYVNTYDLEFLVNNWLSLYDLSDMAAISAFWLGCNNPTDAGCTF